MQELMNFLFNHLELSYALAFVVVALAVIEIFRLKRLNYSIDVSQCVQLINRQNAKIIDIRPNPAYIESHIIDAHSLPSQELEQSSKKLDKLKASPLVLVCNTGVESQKIAANLHKKGYNVYSLAGGMRAWTEAAMPLVKG